MATYFITVLKEVPANVSINVPIGESVNYIQQRDCIWYNCDTIPDSES
jgi:hypothetical protein